VAGFTYTYTMGKSQSKDVAPATINPYTGLPDVGPLPEGAQVVPGGNNGPTIMCANAAVAKQVDGMDGKKDKHYKGVPIAIGRDLSGMAAATGMAPPSTALAASQADALALDAADGVIDGTYFGSSAAVANPYTMPQPAGYYPAPMDYMAPMAPVAAVNPYAYAAAPAPMIVY
jgi:hypothetical protein